MAQPYSPPYKESPGGLFRRGDVDDACSFFVQSAKSALLTS
jgi:hypothetical protein